MRSGHVVETIPILLFIVHLGCAYWVAGSAPRGREGTWTEQKYPASWLLLWPWRPLCRPTLNESAADTFPATPSRCVFSFDWERGHHEACQLGQLCIILLSDPVVVSEREMLQRRATHETLCRQLSTIRRAETLGAAPERNVEMHKHSTPGANWRRHVKTGWIMYATMLMPRRSMPTDAIVPAF